ncbi:MAG: hypothetical protein WBC92_11560 [Terracidiphilus sp.]
MHRGLLAVSFLCAALMAAATPARASEDDVQFFRNLNITPDAPVHDAVCFFCSVHAEGDVNGDIVVFFGNVRLNGEAHHDVVNFFGNVSAADNSSIGGDLVSFFGSVRLGENVMVHKDFVALFSAVHAPSSVSVGKDRVNFSPWIFFGPLFAVILIVFVIVHELRARRGRQFAQYYPLPPRQP